MTTPEQNEEKRLRRVETRKAWRVAHPNYQREWTEKNREKLRAQTRERYKNDPGKVQAYSAKHQEKIRENKRRWAAEHPEVGKAWLARNLDKRKKTANKWARENYSISKQRASRIKSKYGIDSEAWGLAFEAQNKACAICKTLNPSDGWHTDHCHTTKKFRGILCRKCNLALGLFKDNISALREAIAYLERFNASPLPKES